MVVKLVQESMIILLGSKVIERLRSLWPSIVGLKVGEHLKTFLSLGRKIGEGEDNMVKPCEV